MRCPTKWMLGWSPTVVDSVSGENIDWFLVVTGLFGGLAIFLYGMDRLTDALQHAAGQRARLLLAQTTKNRFFGALFGAIVTAIIQSSSVTTVLVVGFVSSGLITLRQGIPIILGANVGTTITAQIVAFNVSRYALAIVAVGYLILFLAKSSSQRTRGNLILGLGLIFFGMAVMGEAMAPLRTYDPFIDLMANMQNPWLAAAVGLGFTALVQSSSATTGIVIVLAGEGLIGLDAGIALVLGANVGTSVTAQLAALGKPVQAVRAAWVHTLFNLIGALIWIPAIGFLASTVAGMGGPVARQVANAHTVFNVANTVLFLAFIPQLEQAVTRLVPDRRGSGPLELKYLDETMLKTPVLALENARLELLRLTNRVQLMLAAALPAVLDGPADALDEVENLDDEIDQLHAQIILYLGKVGQQSLSADLSDELFDLIEATNNLEAIGDIVETNLVALGRQRLENDYTVSDKSRAMITEFHEQVAKALDLAVGALLQGSADDAKDVARMKKKVRRMSQDIALHYASRLAAPEDHRIELYRFETDVTTNLQRVFYFARRIARVAVPTADQATTDF